MSAPTARRVSESRTAPTNGDQEHPLLALDYGISIPASAHTHAGYRKWAKSLEFPERGKLSFIEGEIFVDLSPESLQFHNMVKTEISFAIVRINRRHALGEFLSDRTLITNVEAKLSTEPDASFVRWETLETGRVRLVPRTGESGDYIEVEGTPDWVCEIVSDSSVSKDTKRLLKAYHRAGVPEYWLVDARKADINFQILLHSDDEYRVAKTNAGWQTSKVFKRRFRLTRTRGRMNLWQYRLQVKPLR